jgi:hypothetical protein
MADGSFNGTSCKPLDPFGEYRVAVNDYIAQGGSGFTVLKRNTTKFNTGISLRDALVDFIRTLPDRCNATDYSNITGVFCKDAEGETYDCTDTCCSHDPDQSKDQQACSTAPMALDGSPTKYALCVAGVVCKDSSGKSYDCTKDCCGHDQKSGAAACSANSGQFQYCMQNGLRPAVNFVSPAPYDYRSIACLNDQVEAHDGRIQTIAGGASQ